MVIISVSFVFSCLLFPFMQNKIKQVAFLFSTTPMPEYENIAKQYRGKFVFAVSDGSMQRLNDHVGVAKDNFPQFIIMVKIE